MNPEQRNHKIGTIGELLVKTRLNEIRINTGSVDRDTGTDGILFIGTKILTYQVKTGANRWNRKPSQKVDIEFFVKLNWQRTLALDSSSIQYRTRRNSEILKPFSQFASEFC